MKPIHKLIYTLIASVALLLAGCGGSSNTLSEAEQAKMQRAETQTTALKTAYDAAVAALETLEDDTSDATQAEVDDAQAKLDALKAAITAAVDVAEEVKARYPADALETRLTTARGSAAPALADEQARIARAETQTTVLKTAYDAAVAALAMLEDDTSDATQAEVDDAQMKLDALKAAITAAMDVSEEVKAMYPADALETRLTAARGSAAPALADEQAKMARAETQTTALKMAYDEAMAALAKLKDNTDDATREEVDDAQAKLDALKAAIAAAVDVSDEVKEMYPADTIETELTKTEQLASFGLALERLRMAASKAIEDAGEAIREAGEAIEGAETAIEDLAGIIPFQTGTGNHRVEQDVEKARMDYEQAKRDYEAAKKKNEMERDDADTIAKMNALSVAAEQAKKDAEAAKTAAETARMKAGTDAGTLNRTAVRYLADGTYIVSATSINPTAIGKKKTTDGEKVTGYIETITVKSRLIANGDVATDATTPVTAANNPSVEAGALILTLGNKYDSADDKARLRLITHYVSKTKKIGLRGGDLGEDDIELESTDDVPYGMYDHDDDAETPALELYKASDIDFHVLHTGSNVPVEDNFVSRDLVSYWVENLAPQDDAPDKVSEPTKAGTVFYYGDPDTIGDGVSWALRLTATKTGTDGTIKYVYRKIRVYEGPAAPVLDEAKDYKHINYGIWSTLGTSGNQSADLGIGFVRMLPEGARTGSDMPSGSATWKGHYVANVMNAESAKITEHFGTSTVTAKFDDNTVTVVLGLEDEDGYILNSDDTRLATLEGAISGDRFSGTKVTNIMALGGLTASADNGGDTPIYTGDFSGAFFGAKAAEVGGIFHFAHKDDDEAFNGAFGGVKQPAAE